MDSPQYIHRFPLIMTFVVSTLVTAAAVGYAVANAFLPTDVPGLVDHAVQRHDMTVCASAPDEESRKACFTAVYPVVGTANQCAKIPYTDIQTACGSYFDTLAILKAKADELRQKFTYDQVEVEVTFADNSTKRFKVLVADTDDKRIQGLSYVDLMNANEGMFFAFPADMPDMAFHMKDMLLPLDIVFLNEQMVPVQTFRNLPSCTGMTECPLQRRKGGDVQYVLEILPQGKEVTAVKVVQ